MNKNNSKKMGKAQFVSNTLAGYIEGEQQAELDAELLRVITLPLALRISLGADQ